MNYPKAGWLAVQGKGQSPVFFPHPRFTFHADPRSLSFILGPNMKKNVRIQSGVTHTHSPQMMPVRLIPTSQGDYLVGPFIAILTSSSRNGFRGNRQNFMDLIQTGRKMGVTIYVLTPEGIHPQSQTVRGWVLNTKNGKKRWLSATLPMPHVVYNRIPSRHMEQQAPEQKALKFFHQHPRINLFNHGFFNKWTLYQFLKESSQLKKLLPETHQWDTVTLKDMMNRHGLLYLKPVDGKAGDGIIRVQSQDSSFEVVSQTLQRKQRIIIKQWKDLLEKLTQLIGNRKYVVQQGIPLAKFQNRPFDLRLLMQKDKTGRWTLTGTGIRLAGREAISTHVPMGGSIGKMTTIMKSLFDDQSKKIAWKIEQTGIQLATYIEEKYGRNLGEMSMDLGMETTGRLWFFEANSKPMKFDEPKIRSDSLQKLIHYMLYLSGFHPIHQKRR